MQNRLPGENLSCWSGSTWLSAGRPGQAERDLPGSAGPARRLPKTEKAIEVEIAELARRSRHLERILNPGRSLTCGSVVATRLRAWGAATAYPWSCTCSICRRGVATADELTDARSMSRASSCGACCARYPPATSTGSSTPLPRPSRIRPRSGRGTQYLSGHGAIGRATLKSAAASEPGRFIGRPRPQRTFALRRIEESYGARAGRFPLGQAHHRTRPSPDPDPGVAGRPRGRGNR